MIKIKRKLSLILGVFMLVMALPIPDIAYAAASPEVKGVEIQRNYIDGYTNMIDMYIEVSGNNLDKLPKENKVIARDNLGEPIELGSLIESSKQLYYKVDAKKASEIRRIIVDGASYSVTDDDMGSIESIEPSNKVVTLKEAPTANDNSIIIKGKNFTGADKTAIITDKNGNNISANVSANEIKKIFQYETSKGGNYSLTLTKKKANNMDKLTLIDNYVNLFQVQGKLNVSDDIYIVPTQGVAGSTVSIIGDSLLPTGEMSVFFTEKSDGIHKFNKENMGLKETYASGVELDGKLKDVFTVEVPKSLAQGEYYVVLTNEVKSGEDPENKITSMLELKDTFTVVDASSAASIINVDPNRGPDSGLDIKIEGKNIGTIHESVFRPNDNCKGVEIISPALTSENAVNKLELEYNSKDGSGIIGEYKLINTGGEVYKIKKEISGIIGGSIGFYKDAKFNTLQDFIKAKIYSTDIADGEDRKKDVTLQIKTIYYGPGDSIVREVVEHVKWKDKFEFEKIRYTPKITSVIPEKIPLKADGEIQDGLELNIIGENFLMHRFREEEVEDEKSIKKPVINLGGQAILDPNILNDDPSASPKRFAIKDEDIKMYDKNGKVISGAEGDNLATKISIKLPKGIFVESGVIDSGSSKLTLTNPLKSEEPIDPNDPDIGLGGKADHPIQFVIPKGNKPLISEINPDIVTVDGYKDVVIIGTGFDKDIKLYLAGEEIKVNRESANKLIFDAPPHGEGSYQIIVQNDGGGIAITELTFVETYTDIKLIEFNPKKGSQGTAVTIKGSGFVRAADSKIESISDLGIYKLIGTRVFLGGEDINDYNKDDSGNITLGKFTSGEDLLKANSDRLEVADYYDSLVFVENPSQPVYYSIFYDANDTKYKLTDGHRELYILSAEGDKVVGHKSGEKFQLESKNGSILIKDESGIEVKNLSMKSPYKVSIKNGKTEFGNKVRVVNENEIIFKVPKKPREGFYDLEVVNPDTNRDSKLGNKGFYYSYHPSYNPKIESIQPDEGSTRGGYYIEIRAEKDDIMFKGFVDNGGKDKTIVTIGSVEVDPSHVTVSSDGYTLKVKVPEYKEDMPDNISRKSVAITVVNPDGGSDSVIDGFTYVVAISNPKLKNLFLKKGEASGGKIVVIEGSDFRYFEPFTDENNNLEWDIDEDFTDVNKNKKYDDLRIRKVWVSETEEKELDDLTEEEWNEFVKPILPKVYFGEKEAEIIDFEDGRIEVKTPAGTNGPVQVYLVNNDYGRSNELTYTYEVTNPEISQISPAMGTREGGQTLEIIGSNFVESKVDVIKSETTKENKTIQLVQFGDLEDENISNQKFKLGDTDENGFDNSGKIERRKAKVHVGNLEINYDGTEKTLEFNISEGMGENKRDYTFKYENWNEEDIYLPIKLLKDIKPNSAGVYENYPGIELVKISLEKIEGASTTRRLRVDRGFSPEAGLQNSGHIRLTSPSYYTVGDTVGRVINPDKQEATKEFSYRNPSSKPVITNILRNGSPGRDEKGMKIIDVPYTGGSTIKVEGLEFRVPPTIAIGGVIPIPADILKYEPENSNTPRAIHFEMPKVDSKYIGKNMTLALTNPDGGSTIAEKFRIRFTKPETVNMKVTGLVPNFGPTEGGTLVTIHGDDFRDTMSGYPNKKLKVYFERGNDIVEVPEADIISVEFDKIVLKTPAFTAGLTDVIIENPDGNEVRLLGGFTYKSAPTITSVVDPDNENINIDKISVEGGETIKIKGTDFLDNPRVIFNPVLREVEEGEEVTGDIITIGDKKYILESGVEGTDIEYIDGQNIKVTTPAGKLGDKGVIVINTDGGATNIYNLEYGTPEVGAPFNVRAELVYDQFIRVTWSGVRNALEYEIYVSEDGKSFEYIGSTELTSFSYNDLRPRTKYQFMVRAIGQYGSSKPLDESKSNTVRTGRTAGPEDTDGELGENSVINREGINADISIGRNDFGSKGYTIDLTQGQLAGVKNITIRIPAQIVGGYNSGEVRVLSGDYSMSFNPSVFRNSQIEKNRNNNNAGVVFKVFVDSSPIGNIGGRTLAGPKYKLEAETFIGKNKSPIGRLAGGINLNLDTNSLLVQSRKLRDVSLSRYYSGSNRWIKTRSVDRMAVYAVTGSRR